MEVTEHVATLSFHTAAPVKTDTKSLFDTMNMEQLAQVVSFYQKTGDSKQKGALFLFDLPIFSKDGICASKQSAFMVTRV